MEWTAFWRGPLGRCEQQVAAWSQDFAGGGLRPVQFRPALSGRREARNQLGRESLGALGAQAEERADPLEGDGIVDRCKGVSPKEWFTPWGQLEVGRRLYQANRGGRGGVPLDQRGGRVDRFLVPSLERRCCLLGAQWVPAAVAQALAEALGPGPSRTALQAVVRQVGQHAAEYAGELETAVPGQQPLAAGGEALVGGWDGTMIPLREAGPTRGRPARRPAHTDPDAAAGQPTRWQEAGVGRVAVDDLPCDPAGEKAARRDVRYCARTPEPKMAQWVDAITAQTAAVLAQGACQHGLFLADGRPEIGRTVAEQPVCADFTQVLDCYHACQHLSVAAEALFGPGSAAAQRYFEAWRQRLRHRPGAAQDLLRSLRRYARRRRRGRTVLRRELAYCRTNRPRMDYARLAARGLPIGSGPVEAACKTVVGHRLKRSGMRWSSRGAQQILNLRVPLCSGRWDPFHNWYLEHTDQLALAA